MNKQEESKSMGLMQHLSELRSCLLSSFVAIVIFALLAFNYTSDIFILFTKPFESYFLKGDLIGTGPAEAFILRIKLAFFCGLVFSSPWIFYQIWKFIEPGLYQKEKKLLVPFLVSTSSLFFIGVLFAYCLVLPIAYEFFQGQYDAIGVKPTIRISEHLNLVIKLLLAFAFVFEMPVVSVLLAKMGILNSEMMKDSWRYILIIVFILSAIFTPPDIFSQFLMAVPMIILYYFSYLLVKGIETKNQKT